MTTKRKRQRESNPKQRKHRFGGNTTKDNDLGLTKIWNLCKRAWTKPT